MMNLELEKVLSKKEENYKIKIEEISQQLTFKPFYKKFAFIRNYTPDLKNIKIDKSRKFIQFLPDELKFKFDYISSLIDNPYEEAKYTNETTYLKEEFIFILSSYLIKMNQVNDTKDYNILYLTETLILDQTHFNTNLFSVIQEIINKIQVFGDYSITLKLGINEEIVELMKETNINSNSSVKFTLNLHEIQKLYKNVVLDEKQPDTIIISIKNNKNNSHMRIINLDFNNVECIGALLGKFNEINVLTKKKRVGSSKKLKKNCKNIFYLLDEMEFTSGFFFSSILDINAEMLIESKVKDLLMNF